MAGIKPGELDDLDWVKVREDLDSSYITETIFQKAKRKTQENPLVPLGTLATTAALTVGLISFYKGKTAMQQYMMRARVGAQAFTIVCMVAGLILLSPKSNRD
ncbi:PREDICTED: HIG1 domain family member 2A, mitochondrial [Wasmannia auropunctata]|uniref:HIG1 domain family member 2A, mitochondrial n=1 Tax=Wasmannia auropunctata TaxID=64793 RepID=UPI0005EE6335|nr:PREDICTED: HIG1 domain family member 2A, mitochondrial [Wasmannia auropunctata]